MIKKLDIYLDVNSESTNFSLESIEVLSLINYCELRKDNLNLNLCLNDDTNEIKKSQLFECYKNIFEFTTQSESKNDEKLKINCKNYNDLNIKLKNVSLPCLRMIENNDDDDGCIVYSGIATLYRAIVNYVVKIKQDKRFKSLLGYKEACLKACKEVSAWTNLCENKSIQLYKKALSVNFSEIGEFKTGFLDIIENTLKNPLCLANRKDLKNSNLKYLEDVKMNISDLLVYFILNLMSFHLSDVLYNFENIKNWYQNTMPENSDLKKFEEILNIYKDSNRQIQAPELTKSFNFDQMKASLNESTSISSNAEMKDFDSKIESFKLNIEKNFQIQVPLKLNRFFTEQDVKLDWKAINQLLNPQAGKLPEKRVERKCQQLENFIFLIKSIVLKLPEDATVVDFCSGGGHLGILVAYFYPKFKIILIDNKEESLENAINRINELHLKNIVIYKANLSSFIGNFDLGIAIHACGSSTDMIINKCIKLNSSVIISPCCYGAIKANESIDYPLSEIYKKTMMNNNNNVNFFNYNILTNYSDRTEKDKKYENMAFTCMELVDTDRILFLREKGYKLAYLTRLLPENCTLKNNVIVASF